MALYDEIGSRLGHDPLHQTDMRSSRMLLCVNGEIAANLDLCVLDIVVFRVHYLRSPGEADGCKLFIIALLIFDHFSNMKHDLPSLLS